MFAPTSPIYRAYCYLAKPDSRKFFVYLGLLWILNAADVWQTTALKYSGNLASEANRFIDHFLAKGPLYFVLFKALAIFLVSLILVRGYFSMTGIKVGDTDYTPTQVRTAIQFLLIVAIIYYLFVVYLPFIIVSFTYQPVGEVING
jgi:hypothetical protein